MTYAKYFVIVGSPTISVEQGVFIDLFDSYYFARIQLQLSAKPHTTSPLSAIIPLFRHQDPSKSDNFVNLVSMPGILLHRLRQQRIYNSHYDAEPRVMSPQAYIKVKIKQSVQVREALNPHSTNMQPLDKDLGALRLRFVGQRGFVRGYT